MNGDEDWVEIPDAGDDFEPFDELDRFESGGADGGKATAAKLALFLGLATWLGACLVGAAMAGAPDNMPANATPGYRIGYYGARYAFAFFPAVLGLVALVLGFRGLGARRASDRLGAWVGLGMAGSYVLLLCVGIPLSFYVGFNKRKAPSAAVPPAQPSPSPSASPLPLPAPSPAPLTEQEITAFAEQVERTLAEGDGSFVGSRCDTESFLHRAFFGLDVDPGFVKGVRSGLNGSGKSLGRQLVAAQQADEGSAYSMLSYRVDPPQVLFRLLGEGVNYYEFTLVRGADGKVSWGDVYVYAGSTRISEAMRRMAVQSMAELRSGQRAVTADIFARFVALARDGKWEQLLVAYKQLPPKRQGDKQLLMLRLRAAQETSDEEYQAALAAIEALGSNEPGMALTLYDAYFLRQEWKRCQQAIDRLERAVGDPFLHSMRAYTFIESKEFDAALTSARKAVETEPDLDHGHVAVLTVALESKDHQLAAEALNTLASKFEYDYSELVAGDPQFADFAKSPAGKAWVATNSADSANSAD